MTPFEKLLVVHLVADWILAQTNWEAQNKAKDWFACGFHAFKWTIAMSVGAMWAFDFVSPGYRPDIVITLALMGILHAIIDRRWPVVWLFRLKEQLPINGDPRVLVIGASQAPPFWLVICMDQVLHIVQVAVITLVLAG